MSQGPAWASRRDRAFASVEVPQQRRLVESTDQGTRRPTEWEEKRARRLAVFATSMQNIMAHLASDISAAVAEALQATRAVHKEVPIACSTEGPGRDEGSSQATAAASASAIRAVSPPCVLLEGGVHLAVSCSQPKDMLACVLPSTVSCVLPLTATPATSPVPLSSALAESPSANIAVGPEAQTSATAKPAASAALESDPITAVHMQSKLIITDSSSSDVLVSMSASLDKPEGADNAVTYEVEQQLTCLSVERSLLLVAAKDVANDDNLVSGTSVLDDNEDSITNKREAIASMVALPIKLIHGDRNSGTYVHPKFRLSMLVHAPWDPGEQAKETMNPIPIRDSLLVVSWLRRPPDRAQFSGGYPHLRFVSRDTISMLPWDPGDSTIRFWNMRILCLCVASYEFLTYPWNSGQQVTDGRKCLVGFCVTMVLYVQVVTDTCLGQLQFCDMMIRFHCVTSSAFSLFGSVIQPGISMFLGTKSFWFKLHTEGYIEIHLGLLLYTWSFSVMISFDAILIHLSRGAKVKPSHYFPQLLDLLMLQSWSVWEAYFSGPKLQHNTQFGMPTWADQKGYKTEDYIESIRGPSFCFGTIGNYSIYGSSPFRWYILASTAWEIAWAFRLEDFDWSFQFRQPFYLADVSDLLNIMYAGINTLQMPWDPGACSASAQRQGNPEGLNDSFSNTRNAQVPWDPGGSSQDRLGGKPNFKKGGLSAALLVSEPSTRSLGWKLGRRCWASACSEDTRGSRYKYNGDGFGEGAWTERKGFGLAWLASVVHLLPLVPLFLSYESLVSLIVTKSMSTRSLY